MSNNPIRFIDPTGHYEAECAGFEDNCENKPAPTPSPEPDLGKEEKEKKKKGFKNMQLGDIVAFETVVDGKTVIHNYMLGLLDDHETLGFWDLDTHSYVPYDVAATEVDLSDRWTVFRKTNPKSFSSYEAESSGGTPLSLNKFDYYWTGGVDDNPGYVEIATKVDWENVPDHFVWSVLGPGSAASAWMNAKPSVTPLNNAGYWPLTNYLAGLTYFANDGAALERYPLIHLQPSLTERIFNPLQ